MSTAQDEPKLLFPGLAGFYGSWSDIADTAVRVVIGYNLFRHGWVKVTLMGTAGVSGFMAKMGLHPGTAFALAAMFLETIGALCIVTSIIGTFFVKARDGGKIMNALYRGLIVSGVMLATKWH